MEEQETFILQYFPEKANAINLFIYFGLSEYSFDHQGGSLVRSICSRLEKCSILWSHLQEVCGVAHLKEREELNQQGYTGAIYSKLATAVFEAILDQYYSIYSNFALVMKKIDTNDNLPDRWSKLKNGAIEGKYHTIPSEVRNIFKSNEIYDELRKIRTESAHFSTGDLNLFSKPYSYTNPQIGPIGRTPSNVGLIENIEEFYNRLWSETHVFLNRFFQYELDSIEGQKQKLQFCGFYHKYVYQRYESYSEFRSGNRGCCKPIWEVPNSTAPPCPLAGKCKAYQNYLNNQ